MRYREFFINLRLFVRPLIASVFISCMWYVLLFRNDIHFSEGDGSAFTDAVIPVIAAFHAILAGFVVNKVWNEYTRICVCCKKMDRDGFKEIVGNRIPVAIHMLLGSMAIIIELLVMLLNYERADAGCAMTFSVAFVLILYWEVAINLDDPRKGVWYVQRIPPQWLEPDESES
jgi:hypothetical protein